MNADERRIRDLIAQWHRATAAGNVGRRPAPHGRRTSVFLVPGKPPMQGRASSGLAAAAVASLESSTARVEEISDGRRPRLQLDLPTAENATVRSRSCPAPRSERCPSSASSRQRGLASLARCATPTCLSGRPRVGVGPTRVQKEIYSRAAREQNESRSRPAPPLEEGRTNVHSLRPGKPQDHARISDQLGRRDFLKASSATAAAAAGHEPVQRAARRGARRRRPAARQRQAGPALRDPQRPRHVDGPGGRRLRAGRRAGGGQEDRRRRAATCMPAAPTRSTPRARS